MRVDISKKDIFNLNGIVKFISYYLVFIIFGFLIMACVLIKIYSDTYKNIEKDMFIKESYDSVTIQSICIMLRCKGFVYTVSEDNNEKTYYTRYKDTFEEDDEEDAYELDPIFLNFNKNWNIVVKFYHVSFIIQDELMINTFKETFYGFIIISFVPFNIIFTILWMRHKKSKLISKGLIKSELETRLQRDLTEMLHHELNAPLALISTQVEELYELLYPCVEDPKALKCDLGTTDTKTVHNICRDCSFYKNRRELDTTSILLFRDIEFSIERLNAVLEIMANSKHIRFSNGTVPLLQIINNIVSSVNSFKLAKVGLDVDNPSILEAYSISSKIGNGNMMNIFHVLINNALEAHANNITIKTELLMNDVENKMIMYLSDNGTGIKNCKGEYKVDKNIFKYGYTTKSDNCDTKNYKILSIFRYLISLLGFHLEDGTKTGRGIGLFISKKTLQNAGGDIEITETSAYGTTFKLTLPVKKTIYDYNISKTKEIKRRHK